MSMPLNTLLFQIQTVLFMGSSLLLAGSVAGLFVKNRFSGGGSFEFFSGNDHKSDTGEGSQQEKRRARRFSSNTLLELMNSSGEVIPDSARMCDISLKGACFDSALVLAQGKQIDARLHSSKEGLIQISAHVVWLKPRSSRIVYGVEFDSVRPARS